MSKLVEPEYVGAVLMRTTEAPPDLPESPDPPDDPLDPSEQDVTNSDNAKTKGTIKHALKHFRVACFSFMVFVLETSKP